MTNLAVVNDRANLVVEFQVRGWQCHGRIRRTKLRVSNAVDKIEIFDIKRQGDGLCKALHLNRLHQLEVYQGRVTLKGNDH